MNSYKLVEELYTMIGEAYNHDEYQQRLCKDSTSSLAKSSVPSVAHERADLNKAIGLIDYSSCAAKLGH
jgi:hypothetical protein